jgi:hypothetical protein
MFFSVTLGTIGWLPAHTSHVAITADSTLSVGGHHYLLRRSD